MGDISVIVLQRSERLNVAIKKQIKIKCFYLTYYIIVQVSHLIQTIPTLLLKN